MAFAPDEAIPRLGELTPTGIQLYLFHCRWRDHLAKVSRATLAQFMRDHGVKKSAAYAADAELRAKRWIGGVESGAVVLLVGDFSRVDEAARKRADAKKRREGESPNAENLSGNPEKFSADPERFSGNLETHNKDLSSPLIQPSYPATYPAPTPPSPPREAPPSPAANRVGGGSRFTFEQVLAWAEHEARQDPTIRSARSLAEARLRDGAADPRVEAFHAPKVREAPNPLAGIDPRLCPDCHGSGFEVLEEGAARAARRCKHPRLLETWINLKRAEAPAEGPPN